MRNKSTWSNNCFEPIRRPEINLLVLFSCGRLTAQANVRATDKLNMKKLLYHFTSCESLLKILLSNKLVFSNSITLDDPFERWRARNYSDWGPNIPETAPAAKYLNYFNNLVNQTNILCFFDDSDEEVSPISNLKMWSHYGKSHKGCCIVLDKEKTVSLFKESVKECISDYGRVEYNNLKNYIHKYWSIFEREEYKDCVFKELFHNLFFNKATYYSGENEFRFAVNNGNEIFSFEVIPLVVKVVVAENVKQIDLESIVSLSKLLRVEVGKMFISDDKLEYWQVFAP